MIILFIYMYIHSFRASKNPIHTNAKTANLKEDCSVRILKNVCRG